MDQSPSVLPPQPSQPPTAPTSLGSRLLNILAAPGEVFDEVKAAAVSVGNWLAPALIYGVVAAVAYVAIFSNPALLQKAHEERARGIDKAVERGKMSREQGDQMLAMQEKFAGPTVMKIIGAFSGIITGFLELFWWALLLWLIGRVCLRSPVKFMKTVEVAGLACMIASLEALVRFLLVISTNNALASPSLALLIKAPNPQSALFGILSMINPVIFWLLAVRSIGLAKLCGVSFAKAATWVFSIWLVMMGAIIGVSQAAQAFFSQMK